MIGAVFAVMMLAVVFEDYTPRRLSILFLVLFWIPMLVLHEFGHALMARLLGWQVREIVIGFGRDIWHWRIGETHIRIKRAPIEGYVLPAPVGPSRMRLKSMLIYAAGPGAELLLLGALLILFGWDGVFNDSDEIFSVALQSLAVVILIGAGFNLVPFYTDGAVSDGMGIITSPFMSRETIELRLASFELREVRTMANHGESAPALQSMTRLMRQYPDNRALKLQHVSVLSADHQDDEAREIVREMLAGAEMSDHEHREWLHMQALVELDAREPSFLVLDLALQKALQDSPNAPDLLATKGAAFVLRGQNEMGGNMLADAWRRSGGGSDDDRMLAYLAIAAHRCGDQPARDHFRSAFDLTNRSLRLRQRVESMAGQSLH
jgi:hypothetical protein